MRRVASTPGMSGEGYAEFFGGPLATTKLSKSMEVTIPVMMFLSIPPAGGGEGKGEGRGEGMIVRSTSSMPNDIQIENTHTKT